MVLGQSPGYTKREQGTVSISMTNSASQEKDLYPALGKGVPPPSPTAALRS